MELVMNMRKVYTGFGPLAPYHIFYTSNDDDDKNKCAA